MLRSFQQCGCDVRAHDRDKKIGRLEDCLDRDVVFLALPTPYDAERQSYNLDAIHEVCAHLHAHTFRGLVVLKSTVTPHTTDALAERYGSLKLVHNPEFLSTATAEHDFHTQRHVILGKHDRVAAEEFVVLERFYRTHYPRAQISTCTCAEAEMAKMACNTFYAVKIQFFNEIYAMCGHAGVAYEPVKTLMLANGWIHAMHTSVPGPDGNTSFGGACFPKDARALLGSMRAAGVPRAVLQAAIEERDAMRGDAPLTHSTSPAPSPFSSSASSSASSGL